MGVAIKKIVLVCSVQVLLVLLYIHKENTLISRLYAVQTAQKSLALLKKRQENLHHELQQLQDYTVLHAHAEQAGMKKARLTDMKRFHE